MELKKKTHLVKTKTIDIREAQKEGQHGQNCKAFNKQGDLGRKDNELTAVNIAEGQVARATATE